MPFIGNFKGSHNIHERLQMSLVARKTRPKHVPIILERFPRSGMAYPQHGQHICLVPGHITMGQFQARLRRSLKMDSNWALFVMVGGVLAPTSQCLGALYAELAESDGFLYVSYVEESTFG